MILTQLKMIGVWILLSILSPLWAKCPLALTNAIVSPTPLEYKGVGRIEFYISEEDGRAISAKDSFGEATCTFVADLNKIVPKDKNVSFIQGEINTYFNLSYKETDNQVHFTQKIEIPANKAIKIVIPIDVIAQSPRSNPFNGFIINVHASSESISQYTSTAKVILLAHDNTVNGIAGTLAIKDITKNDTINAKAISLGKDVNITSVTHKSVLVIDKTTGKVSIPAGTKNGTYTETYTICETYDTKNCATANISVHVKSPLAVPSITSIDGHSENASVISDNTPEIKGTCQTNLTVMLQLDSKDIQPKVPCNNGTFTMIPKDKITEGKHVLRAIYIDANGTRSKPSLVKNFTLNTKDIQLTEAPHVDIITDRNNDGKLDNYEAEANVSVKITFPQATKVGTLLDVTDGKGRELRTEAVTQKMLKSAYTFSLTSPDIGKTLTIHATLTIDSKVSKTGTDSVKRVKGSVVATPSIQAIAGDKSATVQTTDTTPRITGTCVTANKVTVQIDEKNIEPTVLCSAHNTFSITPSVAIAKGTHALSITQTNAAGVISARSVVKMLTISVKTKTKTKTKTTPTPTPTPTATPTASPTPTVSTAPTEVKKCTLTANNDLDIEIKSLKGTSINVLSNDSCVKSCGKLSYTQGVHGTVSIDDADTANNPSDDLLVYVPEKNDCKGTDSFDYTISDCDSNSATGTVTLNLQCSNTKKSNGMALDFGSMILMIFFTGMIALYMRREEHHQKTDKR